MSRHTTQGTRGGMTRQSGAVVGAGHDRGRAANGLCLSGVVVATYVQKGPQSALPAGVDDNPAAVYCDVQTYGTAPGLYAALLVGVPVVGAGMHAGRVWAPRPATLSLAGGMNPDTLNPRDLDGDHVLVQFLDNDLDRPIITGLLPHPRTGEGNDALPEAGHRMRLAPADGAVDLHKHQGSFYGLDKAGNLVVDTTRAHDGKYTADGKEQPAEDADHGGVVVRAAATAKVLVVGLDKDGAGEVFRLELEDGKLTVQMAEDANKLMRLDTATGEWTVRLDADKALTLDGAGGALSVELGATTLELDSSKLEAKLGGDGLKLEQMGPSAVLKVGDGTDNAVSFTQLDTWWAAVGALLSSHVHPTTAPGAPTLSAPTLSSIATAPPPSLWKLGGLKVRSGPA